MQPSNHVLVVDDDRDTREIVARALSRDNLAVTQVDGGDAAIAMLEKRGFNLIITDLYMPGTGGEELLAYVEEHLPGTPVIIITGYGTVGVAVEAMHKGAFDFQQKPLNLEHLRLTVRRALNKAQLKYAVDYLRHEQPYIHHLDSMVAQSPAMRRVLDKLARVAETDITVLLAGETGTGKSLLAGAIHTNSARRAANLVTVNCAALTETLLESELFGHEKGAFTGAHKARTGRFQQAHGGTLFLDEVGDMSPATQAKTLRAIEDKEVHPIGGSRAMKVDVRIIAATNLDLQQAVREGAFREDLYYRLSVAPIKIPPLRQRKEDILPLAETFLDKFRRETRFRDRRFSQEASRFIQTYHWPGNIRELRNSVERAVLFAASQEIGPADLGLVRQVAEKGDLQGLPTLNLGELERMAVEDALRKCDWVQSRAAVLLGISPRTLSYKLDKLGISHPGLEARRRR
ncbi:acetoacetate metabolism regulatory protein AtoC [Desulfoferula mesophila]|uniref:Acetoacetate metabolism regulatory protein AtoC n=1 Tax=Desulfoferula mesophila TaxID=3058419 RepID=A0AAU9E996_9BACT|nr:acetoacetate metabolism regulatory protein AtoC [Desulfoferula mesophilus]